MLYVLSIIELQGCDLSRSAVQTTLSWVLSMMGRLVSGVR